MSTMIWPIYIDRNKSRGEGRKVSLDNGVAGPKLKEVYQAAKNLKFNPEMEADASYPGEWYNNSGRVFVETPIPKKNILIAISEEIKVLRNRKQNKKR
ncbi:signal recognition particle subunit SRP19/SEC65 family protein [Methanobrevibacter sp. UBA417]|jgi:signal recognition particle subunit SRP19|uniref:signal recognition particle subunit SRP19/SEC65 family protein n=1 Tax=Methanobrevibacter sp. UBA417 TaxID=1915487 RepID=UPI0039B90EBE